MFLLRELPRNVFDVRFAVLGPLGRFDSTALPILPTIVYRDRCGSVWQPFFVLYHLISLIRRLKPDVVHAMCRTSELGALVATMWAGHGEVLGVRRNTGYWHTWQSRWVARVTGLLGAEYAANCDAARDFAAQVEWIPKRRVCVIRNPVPSKRLEEGLANVPPRASLGIRDGQQVVGMVATVRPVKDYATFLRSARLVLDKHPNTRFLSIGVEEPNYGRQMRQLARDLGIEGQVCWLGSVANPVSIVPLMDVAVLSSRSEAFSNAVLEYAAVGAAIVATDVGGIRELVADNVTGLLAPPQSPASLSHQICRLLEDAALRKRLGENASRSIRERCSEDKVLEQYSALYRRLTRK